MIGNHVIFTHNYVLWFVVRSNKQKERWICLTRLILKQEEIHMNWSLFHYTHRPIGWTQQILNVSDMCLRYTVYGIHHWPSQGSAKISKDMKTSYVIWRRKRKKSLLLGTEGDPVFYYCDFYNTDLFNPKLL